MKAIVLTVPEPCHENWNNMSPVEKGRYCQSCQKQVVDFSLMNDKEITAYLNNAFANVCGNFLPAQLNRELTQNKKAFNWKPFWKILLPTVLFSFKFLKAQAQLQTDEKKPVKQVGWGRPYILGKVIPIIRPADKPIEIIITAIIKDEETGEVIPGVSIVFVGSSWGTVTDAAGIFNLKIQTKNIIGKVRISAVGYESKEIFINEFSVSKEKIIQLKRSVKMLDDVMLTCDITSKRLGMVGYVKISKQSVINSVKDKIINSNQVKIFPNPVAAGNQFAVELSSVKKGDFIIQFMDLNGQVISQNKFYVPAEQYIFYSETPASISCGQYFIRIINAESVLIYSGKIMIQ